MPETDANAHFRERRRKRKQRVRRRRGVALVVLALIGAAVGLGAGAMGGGGGGGEEREVKAARHSKRAPASTVRARPPEIRGVHVTMALASLPGKLASYVRMPGLNTIELDVKDENGQVGFPAASVPLATRVGAALQFYKPRQAARLVHGRGHYLIGRVVVFEDPVLSEKRPDLAVRTSDGSRWLNNAGLGWSNPYDRRVWRYNVDIAAAAAKAGFDEIQFDYVRFPSDGDISIIRYPGSKAQPMEWTIPAFVQYAAKRLRPLGVRISVDVFGLSATRDLGIGQRPRRIARYVDAVYPMVYPSHYRSGEYGLPDPNAAPGVTVARSLQDFQSALTGRKAQLIPWLQDFSLGRSYSPLDVQRQILAARSFDTGGYLLWNPEGLYTVEALAPSG
jgi:hypothetical protein